MKRGNEIFWSRWLFLPCALWALVVVVPCPLAYCKQHFLKSSDYVYWSNADFWTACLAGVIVGFAWVTITGAIAPSHKRIATCLSSILGCMFAGVLMGEPYDYVNSVFPSQGFKTHAPLYLCVWSGMVGLFVLWLRRKRGDRSVDRNRRPRRVIGLAVLVVSGLAFGIVVVPATVMMWRYSLYHLANQSVVRGSEDEALRTLRRFIKFPLFDLDWTPGKAVVKIPFATRIDENLFGCPSCRGIHSPLFHAVAARGYASLLQQMLVWRQSPDYDNDSGQGVLAAAICSGDTNTVAVVLSHRVTVEGSPNDLGWSPLHVAVIRRAPEALMTMLINAGAPINARTQAGQTPLDVAHIWEPDAISFLVAHGATNATVRVHLVPIPGSEAQFQFEGTPFGIHLPAGFSPVNRIPTPDDNLVWEIQNGDGGSLRFGIGNVPKVSGGTLTTFNGFAAVVSWKEYEWDDGGWSAYGRIDFDSSGTTYADWQQMGKTPHYDAFVDFHLSRRRDLKSIRQALASIVKTTAPGRVTEEGLQRAGE